MKSIRHFYQRILNIFVIFFKIINENSQINILNSISKDHDGNIVIFASSLNSSEPYPIYPHLIISNQYLKNQFRKSDLKIIESIVLSEGDIFISEKEYCINNGYSFSLFSIITSEKWSMAEKQILNTPEVLNRVNKRFLNHSKELKYVHN